MQNSTSVPVSKLFDATIAYYKIITVFGVIACFVLMFFKSFDPQRGLEQMIVTDLYGTSSLPADARPMFELIFLLFDWLSVLALAAQYLVIKYALEKREEWALWYMVLIGFFWPLGAAVIAWHTRAYSYLVSAGMMLVMFFPPLLILRRYFK